MIKFFCQLGHRSIAARTHIGDDLRHDIAHIHLIIAHAINNSLQVIFEPCGKVI